MVSSGQGSRKKAGGGNLIAARSTSRIKNCYIQGSRRAHLASLSRRSSRRRLSSHAFRRRWSKRREREGWPIRMRGETMNARTAPQRTYRSLTSSKTPLAARDLDEITASSACSRIVAIEVSRSLILQSEAWITDSTALSIVSLEHHGMGPRSTEHNLNDRVHRHPQCTSQWCELCLQQ